MSNDFAKILRGLMENRGLTPRAVSRASARAESTINQLLSGRIPPRIEILRDIAPVLQIELSDLLVIADIPEGPTSQRKGYVIDQEIGELVAAASYLEPEQVRRLIERARRLKSGGCDE